MLRAVLVLVLLWALVAGGGGAVEATTPSPTPPSRSPTKEPTYRPTNSPSLPTSSPTSGHPTPRPTWRPTFTPTRTWPPTLTRPDMDGTVRALPVSTTASELGEFDRIDLDLRDLDRYMRPGMLHFANARAVFTQGRYSEELVGNAKRSVYSLTTAANGNNNNNSPLAVSWTNFFGQPAYGANRVLAALSDTSEFANRHWYVRAEVGKGALFWAVLPAVEAMLYGAVMADECENGDPVAALDRAWALYAGTLPSFNASSPSGYTPFSLYTAADQACAWLNDDCASSSSSQVNANIYSVLRSAAILAARGSCAEAKLAADEFAPEINTLLAQRAQKAIAVYYASTSTSELLLPYVPTQEEAMQAPFGEYNLTVKMRRAAVHNVLGPLLPHINRCSSEVRQALERQFAFDVVLLEQEDEEESATEMLRRLQSVYPCLGVSCERVGGTAGEIQACVAASATGGATAPPSSSSSFPTLALYSAQSDITAEADIDVDVAEMRLAAARGDMARAKLVFMAGRRIAATSSRRLSSTPPVSLNGLADPELFYLHASDTIVSPVWFLFRQYYENEYFAGDLVLNALGEGGGSQGGLAEYQGESSEFRATAAVRAAQVVVAWHQVLLKLHMAVRECEAEDSSSAAAASFVDQAWAYHTGSTTSLLLHHVNEEQCAFAGSTCSGASSPSPVNTRLATLFAKAQLAARLDGQCGELANLTSAIQAQMTVPLLQGLVHHSRSAHTSRVAWAEAWVFAYAALPMLDEADASVAAMVRRNLDPAVNNEPGNSANSNLPMESNTPHELAVAVIVTLDKLGLTCSQLTMELEPSVRRSCPVEPEVIDDNGDDYGGDAGAGGDGAATAEEKRAHATRDAIALIVVLPLLFLCSLLVTYVFVRRYFFIHTSATGGAGGIGITGLVAAGPAHRRNSGGSDGGSLADCA